MDAALRGIYEGLQAMDYKRQWIRDKEKKGQSSNLFNH